MTRSDLVAWVRTRLDEIAAPVQTPSVNDSTIERELDAAYLRMVRDLRPPLVYFFAENLDNAFFGWTASNAQYKAVPVPHLVVPLPSAVVRFLRGKLNTWNRYVDVAESPISNTYKALANPFATATEDSPAIAVVPHSGGLAVEMYPANASDTVEELLIVRSRAAETTPDAFTDLLVWYAVAQVAAVMRQGDIAQYARQQALEWQLNARFGVRQELMAQPEER